MPEGVGALRAAPDLWSKNRRPLRSATVQWRALVAAALLSLALGAALYQVLAGERSTVARGAHARASSHKEGLFGLPAAAQGPVSAALGAAAEAYRISPSGGGFAAANPAQRLALRFERSGVTIRGGATRVGLSAREMGYGGALSAVGEVTPRRVKANRVLYERAGLSEWYANGPLGLEQGFAIARAPAGHRAGPLTLALALSGNAHASLRSGGQSIALRRAGGPELRYSGLSATDARRRVLRSWLALDAGRLLLHVDTRGARYPVRIDPFVQQGEKLTGSGARGEEGSFGYSVALSSDGNTALIGGSGDNGQVGAAWVFTREGSSWKQQGAKLTGRGESGRAEFGYSVALTPEGNTALIGGPGDVGPGKPNKRTGAAWVFTRSGSTWTQQGEKLTAKAGEEIGEGEFGGSVALSSEAGATALIGGPNDGHEVLLEKGGKRIEPRFGAAWVFTRSGSTWTQQGEKLVGGGEIGKGEFGRSVALASNGGNTALIGGPADNASVGAAWAFIREGTTWKEQAKLTAKSGEEIGAGSFGASLALASDGSTGLIGARGDNAFAGAAWVFTRAGSTWTQQGAKLTAKAGEEIGEGEFGRSVALASNGGNTALIGGPGDNGMVGAAWVFTRSGSTWTQQGAKLTGSGESGRGEFGYAVALSSEGSTALIGGPGDSPGVHAGVGAAWVFTRSGSTWTQQGAKLTGSGEIGEGEASGKGEFGYSVALAADGNTALIGGPRDNSSVGAAWIFTRSGSTWTQQGEKLTAKGGEEVGLGEFGKSVALASNGGNYALVGAPGDNGGVGAAWVFTRSGSTWTQQGAKLTAKSGEEVGTGHFGASVALSSEGSYALIGGGGDAANLGAAWVFTREGSSWTQQGGKLTAKSGEEVGEGRFGESVALSSEGTYALIGAPGETVFAGAAWVFTRTGSTWTQQGAKLTAKSGEEIGAGEFGRSVALAAEGNYALIGGPGDAANVGAAWVFTRSGSTWSQQGAKLIGSGEVGEAHFGSSVALSSDKEGNYALIGGPADNRGIGAAWVFTRSGSTWSQQGGKLTGSSAETGEGEFGGSVALSSEAGATALIGSPHDAESVGAAWVFTRSGTTWTQQGEKLTGSGETGEGEFGGKGEFGYGVALSSDGNTALIGGRATLGVGAAWVFTRSGATWTQQGAKLTGSGASAAAEFGSSVALSSDGNTALIGGPGDKEIKEGKEQPVRVGAAWAFTRSGSTWTQQGAKLTGSGEAGGGELGKGVALSSDGNTALIGGPGDNGKVGAAWAFTRSGSTWTQQGAKLSLFFEGSGEIGAGEVGKGVALSSDGNTAVLGGPADNGKVGAAWTFTRSGSTWTPGAKLTGSGESGAGELGFGVALSSGNTALFGGPADNGKVGAAWVFTRSGSTWTQQGAKLTGSGETGAGELGFGVALSSDGNTALMGGPGDAGKVGAAWVFTRSGSTWTQQGAKLTAKSPEEIGSGQFGSGVALSSDGNTALIGGPGDNGKVGAAWAFLNPSPTVVTEAPSAVTQTSATLNATVNPNGGEVSECKFEYGTTTAYGQSAPCTPAPGSGTSPVAVSASVTGLGGNTTYHFRVSATNSGGNSKGSDQTFKTLLGPPAVETKAPSEVKQTSATLNATVNPMGAEVSECKFEWGTTTAYGQSAPCASLPGSGTSPVAVSASVSGLTANTTYHFRVSATNAGGTSKGSDQPLKTLPNPPTVVTEAPSEVKQTSATVNATVNPNGGEVSECKFEYGTTTAYGQSAPCASLPGSGTSPVAVSASVSGLTANTTYHFRVSATNAGGASTGSDQTFKTLPNAPTVVTGAASALTQTSATLNATVNPNGGEVSECKLEYGTTTSYGSSAPCTPAPGSGTSPVAVSASVSGLTANTTYHFRVSATNAGGRSEGSDQTFKTLPNVPTVLTEAASAITQTSATLNATVNPNGGEVSQCRFEWGEEAGALFYSVPCASLPGSGGSPVAVSASLTGLIRATNYYFRITATNAGGTSQGSVQTFITLPNPPTVVTEAASEVTPTSAKLNASVNANGAQVSECKLEYGTSTAYGSSAPCTPAPGKLEHPVAVSASVSGLTPNTTYHFRISATNAGGTSTGSDQTFKTLLPPPTVVAEAPSSVTQTSATLNATVNPNGGEVSACKFEFGTTTAYGQSAPCASLPGSGTSPVAVSASVSGLTPNTTYHFRISATNVGGTGNSSDRAFATVTPHYYSNGAKLKEGTAFTKISITWGAITLRNVKGGVAGSFVTCRSVGAATLFNPAGGAAGEGLIQAFATFACESEGICPVGQSTAIVAESLPWHNILTQEPLSAIRQETNGVKLFVQCLVGAKLEGGSKFVIGAGEKGLRPTVVEGTSALHPGIFEFNEGSGELEAEGSGATVTRKVEGAVKILGYNAQELIGAANP